MAVAGRIGIVLVGFASFALFLFALLMTLWDFVDGMVCF